MAARADSIPKTSPNSPEGEERIHPIRLARMLADAWPTLSESARQVCMEELQEGGVLQPPAPSVVEKFVKVSENQVEMADLKMDVLRTQLKMVDGQQSGPLDLVDLLGLIVELAGHVTDLGTLLSTVWPAWQGLSRSARVQPSKASRVPMARHLRDYLDGHPNNDLLAALRDQHTAARLLIAILSALGQGSQSFAKECSQFIDPETIQHELRTAKKRAPTIEELWQRYRQLSNVLTPNEIEHRLQQQIVGAVESFFKTRS